MNIHICLVGLTMGPILDGLDLYGAIDKIYLLHSLETKKTAAKIKTLVNKVSEKEIILQKIQPFHMEDIVNTILEIHKNESKNKIFVNITGGTRIMSGAACSASFFIGAQAYYVLDKEKNPSQSKANTLVELPIPKIPFYETLDPIQKKILHILNSEEKYGVSFLREKLKISPQSLSYHLRILKKRNLIETMDDESDTRRHILQLKNAGKLMANWT